MTETANTAEPTTGTGAGRPAFSQALRVFAYIGIMSFGGPAAQIAVMHRMLVDENPWLTEQQFLNALSFCMLLPGPEAMQLATFAGWRLHGMRGGLVAGLLFVLPGAAVMLGLGVIYVLYGSQPVVGALFLGIKAAVLIVVIQALLKVSAKALDGLAHWMIAGLAFIGIFFLNLPFPLIIAGAALYGFFFDWQGGDQTADKVTVTVSPLRTAVTIMAGLVIWLVPVALIGPLTGDPVLSDIGAFFSRLAVVTFGGAYAVLAYMAQDVVTGFGWLTAAEMMDGLGLAETTPGPLILVTEFVGFVAAWKAGGITIGLAGAAITLWVTFVPCFLWIFAGAPYIDYLSTRPRLTGALRAITAAVVGVILNLSVWFALHVIFADVTAEPAGPFTLWLPDLGTLDWRVAVLTVLCGVLLLRVKLGLLKVLAISAASGWALTALV